MNSKHPSKLAKILQTYPKIGTDDADRPKIVCYTYEGSQLVYLRDDPLGESPPNILKKPDTDYLNGYLLFVKNMFLYQSEDIDTKIIDNIAATLESFRESFSNSRIQKSKGFLMKEGFSGLPQFYE